MGYGKHNFRFNLDDLGKAVEDFITNSNINDIFGADFAQSTPPINVKEYAEHLQVAVAAPGLEKKDFEIHVEKDVLTIAANKNVKETEEDVKVRRNEFNYSTFKRTFRLSNEFDGNRISATYNDGILNISIPKKKKEETSKIKVDVL